MDIYNTATDPPISYISFTADSQGRGDFYVDNVFSPATTRYTLTTNVIGSGSILRDPGESTYANDSTVELTAVPDSGWAFVGWSGSLTGSTNPETLTMDSNKIVTATFRYSIDVKTYWNLISLPVYDTISKADIIVRYDGHDYTWAQAVSGSIVLGTLYDWQRGTTQAYNPTSTLVPGNGYWMWAYHDCELLIASDEVGTGHITNLQTKWNIIGLPYKDSIVQTLLKIEYPTGNTLTWAEAVAGNIILGFIYGWNSVTQMYTLITTLEPGQGYWMYAYYDCILKE